jgi:colanic acid biosynthesis glycosyl transferase WcaI
MPAASADAAPRLLLHAGDLGPGSTAAEFALWLHARGIGLEIIAPAADAPWWRTETRGGVRITRCPAGAGGGAFALCGALALYHRARQMRPQLIAAIEPQPLSLPGVLLAARRASARAWIHLSAAGAMSASGLTPALLRRFDHVSLAAPGAAEALAAAGIAARRRLALAPWVDTRAIHPLSRDNPLRVALRLDADAVVALYAGSLDPEHGIDRLIEAAARLPANGAVVIVLCGRGAGWRRLAAAAERLPLRLLPWPPPQDLNTVLGLADLHVVPAGLAVPDLLLPPKLAALLASGRPILATGAVPPRLSESISPVADDAASLAAAIVGLAAMPELARRRGAAARRAAQDYHDKERVFRELARALGLRQARAGAAL